MLAVQQTITGGINEGRLMQHLQHFFSTSHTVLAELMQNARRAGASRVSFTMEDGDLVVTDDGCGVADFRALITLAESAWEEDIQKEERPYGIGFLSVCFAADAIQVASRGRQIRFSSADLQGKKPLAITASGFDAGTRVTLEKFRFSDVKTKEKLERYAMGFPIPVVWQGEELARPFAVVDGSEWADTPVGKISAVGIHWRSKYFPDMFAGGCRTFLQGLPIQLYEKGDLRTYGEQNIVHLDSHVVQARLPDRDCVTNPEEVLRQMELALNDLWKAHLYREKATLPAEIFANRYWASARMAGCLEIMNDILVLPGEPLLELSDTLPKFACNDNYMVYEQARQPLTRQDVESGNVRLFQKFDPGSNGEGFAKLAWVRALDQRVCFLSEILPDGHWAKPHVLDLVGKYPVRIEGEILCEDVFSGNYVRANTKLYKTLRISLDGVWVDVEEGFAANDVFHVPQGFSDGELVGQLSYFEQDGIWQESDFEAESSDFWNFLAIMTGEAPEITLRKSLYAGDAHEKSNLRGSAFKVVIDANKTIQVSRMDAEDGKIPVVVTVDGGIAEVICNQDHVDCAVLDLDNVKAGDALPGLSLEQRRLLEEKAPDCLDFYGEAEV